MGTISKKILAKPASNRVQDLIGLSCLQVYIFSWCSGKVSRTDHHGCTKLSSLKDSPCFRQKKYGCQ